MEGILLKKKKFLVFILSVLIIMGSVGITAIDSRAESFVNISVGGTVTVKATSRYDWSAYIRFVAPKDGFYSFYSQTESDTYGFLYDENLEEIYHEDDYYDSNFKLITYLKKGSICYIGAGWYSTSDVIGDGSITVCCKEEDYYDLSDYSYDAANIYVYNGKYLNNPTVRFKINGTEVSGAKYKVQFKNGSDFVDTIPDKEGTYNVKVTGIAPYTGTVYCEMDIVYVTFDDVSLSTPMYQYSGSPIPVSDFKLGFGDGGFYIPYGVYLETVLAAQLTLGKDYKYDGYYRYDSPFMSGVFPDKIIKWRSGTPTETGSYMVKFTGIGDFSGSKMFPIYIIKNLPTDDLNSIEIKNSNNSLKLGYDYSAFELKPNETDTYTLSGSYDMDEVVVKGGLFDSNGRCIKDFASNKYRKSFECSIDMEKGKTYYLLFYLDIGEKDELSLNLSIKGKTKTYTWYTPVQPVPEKKALEKGKTFIVGKFTYKVTKSDGNKSEVSLVKNSNKNIKNVTVAASVKYEGFTYKVTAIGASAFKNNKKLTKATIGSNVKTIGKNAFSGDKKLKTVTIKTKSLKKVGKYAFKAINKKAVIKTPKAKKKAYTKLLKKSKLAKTIKIK